MPNPISGSSRTDTEPRGKHEGTDWRGIGTVGLVLGLTQLGFYLTSAALPLYLRDLGAAEGHIGPEIGIGSIAALGVTFTLGPALNRYGSRLFLRLSAALYVATCLGMLLVPNEIAIAAFRGIQGLASAALVPSALTLGSRLTTGRHATVLGALGAANSIMLATGPPIGLILYADHGAGGLFLPAAAASALGLLSTVFLPSETPTHNPAPGFGFDPAWTPALAANALASMYFGGIVAYLPLHLRALNGPNAGIFFSADALGVLALRVPTGVLADRHGAFLPKLLGVVISAPGIAALALPPTVLTLLFSGAATGIGAGMFLAGVLGEMAGLSSDANRGTAISLGTGSFNGAIFVGSAISGLIIGPGGFNGVLVFGLITTVAAVPLIFARREVYP